MPYRYFERISDPAQRTAALFSGTISVSAESHERDIGQLLDWVGDIRAMTVDADPGPGTVELPPHKSPEPRSNEDRLLEALQTGDPSTIAALGTAATALVALARRLPRV